MASLILRDVLAIVSMTVATIVHAEKPFTATFVDLGEKSPELLDTSDSFDLGKVAPLDETNLSDALSDSPVVDPAGPFVENVTPVDFESLSGPASLGDAGLVTARATDLGTVLPGNGGAGQDRAGRKRVGGGNQKHGGNGGKARRASGWCCIFFGTKSRATASCS